MLQKTFGIHPEVYKYSHSGYSQPSSFYDDSVNKSCGGTQQGDPEGYQSLGLLPFGLIFSSSHLAQKFLAK